MTPQRVHEVVDDGGECWFEVFRVDLLYKGVEDLESKVDQLMRALCLFWGGG